MGSLLSKPTRNELENPVGSKIQLRIAVTGASGVGKSAFINAIRGVNDDDENAAPTGVVDTTREPTEYKHPNTPMISFVDLAMVRQDILICEPFSKKSTWMITISSSFSLQRALRRLTWN